MQPHSVAYAAADADFHATLLNAKLAELEKEVRLKCLWWSESLGLAFYRFTSGVALPKGVDGISSGKKAAGV